MMTDREIVQWSRMGMRGTFGKVMLEYAKKNSDIMIVSADLGVTSGLTQYMEERREQFLNVGIAEQNMIGVATGLSIKGYQVYATSFAPFATARCCEQIKVNLGEMRIPVTVVGIASGFEMEYFGDSHYGFDDIAIMRAVSGLTILSPADTTELVKMLEALQDYKKPAYLRLTKMSRKGLIYKNDFDYKIGKANWIREAGDISIIATGTIIASACLVADRLFSEKKISCGVLDMHTIKPIDIENIKYACACSNVIVTLEEHSIIGGLGSAVAEIAVTISSSVKVLMIGITDEHGHIGDYDFLLNTYHLDAESIYHRILKEIESF